MFFFCYGRKLKRIIRNQEVIMAAIDDLGNAVSTLQTTTDAVLVKVNELKNQPNNDGAISAAVNSINEAVTKLNQAIS